MTQLHLRAYGAPTGLPVLVLHGARGHGGRFAHLVPPGFRFLAPDLRGHGLSTTQPSWSIEQHVADLLETLDTQRYTRAGQQVDLVGYSFGGAVALHLARALGGRLGRMVLLDPSLGRPAQFALESARAALSAPSFDSVSAAREARIAAWPTASVELIDAELAQGLLRGEDRRWRWRYEPAAVVTAFSESTRPAPRPPDGVPTLVVHSRDWQGADLVGAEVRIVHLDCGHRMLVERPAAVTALIETFLAR